MRDGPTSRSDIRADQGRRAEVEALRFGILPLRLLVSKSLAGSCVQERRAALMRADCSRMRSPVPWTADDLVGPPRQLHISVRT
jgi:hypothetical protein